MRVPLSWLADYVDLPTGISARAVASALEGVGIEVEAVQEVAFDLTGPLVVGRVLAFAEEPQSNGKTIRWCHVDVGGQQPQGIVCGAANFAVGDAVVVVLPGAVLPGGFSIAARKTYGHVSDGMICSVRELGLGEDHTGILVLSDADLAGAVPGQDARGLLGIPDAVLDIAVTPDRGYCLSVRGIAREVATAMGLAWRDPGLRAVPDGADAADGAGAPGWPVVIDDPSGCDRFVARGVRGIDPGALSPFWLRRRLALAGMRPISVGVDVTNYVMLELGQPLHGYDRDRLAGPIVVRRAEPGEKIQTLDGSSRALDPQDLLITDDSGPIGVAGVMGGASTELSDATVDVVIEAAHFAPLVIASAARRHRLSSEASRRFERGVDDALAPAAADRVVELLCTLAGGVADPGASDLDLRLPRPVIGLDLGFPAALVGVDLAAEEVVRHLAAVGCEVTIDDFTPDLAEVLAPSWRPDLVAVVDLVEEVARLHGYDAIPGVLPPVRTGAAGELPGADVTRVGRALAGAGYVEVRCYPFLGEAVFDALGLDAGDPRRRALRLANPLSDTEPLLRTTLLPGLLAAARRNLGRGFPDLALFETGAVFRPGPGPVFAPRLGADRRPTEAEVAALEAGLPDQPVHVAVVACGAAEQRGWWGPGRPAVWADAVQAARTIAAAVGCQPAVRAARAARAAPWHPGRCAEIVVTVPGPAGGPAGEVVAGHAGELHPRVCAELGLPPRTCAVEVSLRDLAAAATAPGAAPYVSTFPVASQDVALVVAEAVPATQVADALIAGAGPLLESARLFDVYTGEQVGAGHKSLAYSLRFRAPDRTLTAEEASAARDAAVDEAVRRVGAVPRR
jgi:phenylalanyl-tRNA synthetase beta chain